MTAIQQSLSTKIPRYAALYFQDDNTTGIAPTSNLKHLQGGAEKNDKVTCAWNGEEVDAVIIMISNSRASLNEAVEEHQLSVDEEADQAQPVQDPSAQAQAALQPAPKRGCTRPKPLTGGATGSSGGITVSTPGYQVDEEVMTTVGLAQQGLREAESQTPEPCLVSNGTQTSPEKIATMFALLLARIDQLETKLSERDELIMEQLSALEVRREPPVGDVFTFEDIPPTPTPSTPRTPRTPCTPIRLQPLKSIIRDVGFWKLTPADIFGKDARDVLKTAQETSILKRVTLTQELVNSAKQNSLNSRSYFAKNLFNNLCQMEDLYMKNVSWKVSHGLQKGRIPSEKIDAIRIEEMRAFSCIPSEEKKVWAECVRVMDENNMYLGSVVEKKFDISSVLDYVC